LLPPEHVPCTIQAPIVGSRSLHDPRSDPRRSRPRPGEISAPIKKYLKFVWQFGFPNVLEMITTIILIKWSYTDLVVYLSFPLHFKLITSLMFWNLKLFLIHNLHPLIKSTGGNHLLNFSCPSLPRNWYTQISFSRHKSNKYWCHSTDRLVKHPCVFPEESQLDIFGLYFPPFQVDISYF
jgi:hypothetical protein